MKLDENCKDASSKKIGNEVSVRGFIVINFSFEYNSFWVFYRNDKMIWYSDLKV